MYPFPSWTMSHGRPFAMQMSALKGRAVEVAAIRGHYKGVMLEAYGDYLTLCSDHRVIHIRYASIVSVSVLDAPRGESAEQRIYQSSVYRIRLNYPGDWTKLQGYEDRYGGASGFFQVSAAGGTSIDEVAKNEAFHQLQPYGSTPLIASAAIQGQEARYIWPSDDQPAEMKGQAALIVRYPAPVTISGQSYPFFVLWADKNHLRAIGETLRFMF